MNKMIKSNISGIPNDLETFLGWQFEGVIPGNFRRNRKGFSNIEFPILSPLPDKGASTTPIEGGSLSGPFIYFVVNELGEVCYIGKSKEKTVIKRWVRPGIGGPSTHYWTHATKKAGCVRNIASGMEKGLGPYQLRFIPVSVINSKYKEQLNAEYQNIDDLEQIERGLITLLKPKWNKL